MPEIENKNLNHAENAQLQKIHSMELPTISEKPAMENLTLGPLSKDLAMHLLGLAKKITETEVTPATVNSACKCASELYKIMKLNWDMKK